MKDAAARINREVVCGFCFFFSRNLQFSTWAKVIPFEIPSPSKIPPTLKQTEYWCQRRFPEAPCTDHCLFESPSILWKSALSRWDCPLQIPVLASPWEGLALIQTGPDHSSLWWQYHHSSQGLHFPHHLAGNYFAEIQWRLGSGRRGENSPWSQETRGGWKLSLRQILLAITWIPGKIQLNNSEDRQECDSINVLNLSG